MRRAPARLDLDSGATLFMPVTDHTLQSFQYRIGGKYYPASPVQTALGLNSRVANGGAEALIELQKALNQLGDYRLSTGVNSKTWGIGLCYSGQSTGTATRGCYNYPYSEHDFTTSLVAVKDGIALMSGVTSYNATSSGTATAPAGGNAFAGNTGSANFACAIDLETSNGVEISGLNAEEQVLFNLILV